MTLRFSHGESAVNLRIVEPSDQMHNFHTPVVYLDTQKSHRCVLTKISSNASVRNKEVKICASQRTYLTDRLGGKEAWHPTHFS